MAKGDGSGWHRESRRHAEAAKKGRPTHAKAGVKKPKREKASDYNSPSDAWDHLVGQQGPEEFMEYSRTSSITEAVDDYLRQHPFDLDYSDSNARKMLVTYLEANVGSDRLRAQLDDPSIRGSRSVWETSREWTSICSHNQRDHVSAQSHPTEGEVIRYIKAGAFDPDAVVQMYRSDITPDMAGLRTSAGTGGYSGTVGYKISNGDLRVEDLKSR